MENSEDQSDGGGSSGKENAQPQSQSLCSEEYLNRLLTYLQSLEVSSKSAGESDESTKILDDENHTISATEIVEIRKQVCYLFTEFANYLRKEFSSTSTAKLQDLTLFAKTLSSCLQFICNGILHCSHQKDIYGIHTQEIDNQEFLKQVCASCGTLLVSCFEVTKKNLNQLPKLSSEEIGELMEISVECLTLATKQPSLLPSIAKIFAMILKPFHRYHKDTQSILLGTSMVKHLKELVEMELCDAREMDLNTTTATVKLKTANYFGKIVSKFLAGSNAGNNDWNECLVEALNLAKLAELANHKRKEGLRIIEFYPEIVSALMNIPSFADEVVNISLTWELKLRISLKLKLMVVCSSVLSSSKILISVFSDTTQLDGCLYDFVDEQILPRIIEFIRSLSESALERVQREILVFFIEDWPEKYSLLVADLIANIFSFIVQNLEKDVIEEYVTAFSNPIYPPQIRYFILPSLLAQLDLDTRANKLVTDLAFENIVSKCLNRGNGVLEGSDEQFINLIWSEIGIDNCYSTKTLDKLLPLCISTAQIMTNLTRDLVSQIFLVVQNQFLSSHRLNPLAVFASSVLILGAKDLEFEETKSESTWSQICDVCVEIVKCSKLPVMPACFSVFAMKCVCCFMDCVNVKSEDMILELRLRIQAAKEHQGTSTSTQNLQIADDNASTEYLVPMLEKITSKIVESETLLNPSEKERITAAIARLNNFISQS